MSPLAILFVLASLYLLAILLLRPPGWTSIAPELGLTATRKGIEGWIDGRWVEIRKDNGFEITIGSVNPGFSIERSVPGQIVLRLGSAIGDAQFDDQVRLEGGRSSAFVLLKPDLRESILSLIIDQGGSVSDESIFTKVRTWSLVTETIPLLIDLADQLRKPSLAALAPSIRDVVTGDDLPSVRLAALIQLRDVHYDSVEGLEAARALRHERSADLRLEAAGMLLESDGNDRKQGAEMIQELLLESSLPVEQKLSALSALLEWTDRETALPVIEALIEVPMDSALRQAIFSACRRFTALELLLRFPVDGDVERIQWIGALAEIGDPAAQPFLLEGLDKEEKRVRIAAAEALAALGDVDAIPALIAARRGVQDRELLKAIDTARESIRRRAGVAQTGEISVATPERLEGALSAAIEGGEVSLED